MTSSLPRRVHRNLPRAAPPDSWWSLRSAQVPPVHYLDKLHRPSSGAIRWVKIQSATPTKVGQNSTGVDTVKQDSGEEARLASACAGVALGGVPHKLRLNRIPQRLIDDRFVFTGMGLPLVNDLAPIDRFRSKR
jgi:hypothetical protein